MKKTLKAVLMLAVLLAPCAAFAAEIPTGHFAGWRTFPGQFRPGLAIHWSISQDGQGNYQLVVTSPSEHKVMYAYTLTNLTDGQFSVLALGDQPANAGSTVCQDGADSLICLTKYGGLIETDVFKTDEIRVVANSDGHVWTATLTRPKP